jgi:hypothetical protein
MSDWNFDALVEYVREEFGDDLRWVASFDSDRFTYQVRYIRDDLRTDLSDLELQTIIHRSMAVFNRDHVEDVYFHLGEARSLVVDHENATAFHLYLDDHRGVVVKVEAGASITVPDLRVASLDRLGVESR